MRKLVATSLVLALAIGACSSPTSTVAPSTGESPGSSGEASLEPSASPEASIGPSPSAAASPAPSIGTIQVLPPGAAVEVAVKDLNLRRRPSTGAKRVTTLQRGDVLITSPIDFFDFGYGPVKANGYTWYPVVKLQNAGPDGKLPPLPTFPINIGTEPVAGWIASDDGTRPYVVALPPRCPTTVDLGNLEGMLPAERLACFNGPIVIDGTFGCGGCGGIAVGTFKPKWLVSPLAGGILSVDASVKIGPTDIRFPPDGPERPKEGQIVRITLHVDDPRSRNCEIVFPDDTGALTVAVNQTTAVLWCRERLVVDSYTVTGTDPDFPTG